VFGQAWDQRIAQSDVPNGLYYFVHFTGADCVGVTRVELCEVSHHSDVPAGPRDKHQGPARPFGPRLKEETQPPLGGALLSTNRYKTRNRRPPDALVILRGATLQGLAPCIVRESQPQAFPTKEAWGLVLQRSRRSRINYVCSVRFRTENAVPLEGTATALSAFYISSLVMEVTMSPEQRVKELADSEQEIWRILLLLGMSPETIERSIAFKNKQAGKKARPLPGRSQASPSQSLARTLTS
jgi:hypothetical protein